MLESFLRQLPPKRRRFVGREESCGELSSPPKLRFGGEEASALFLPHRRPDKTDTLEDLYLSSPTVM